MPAFSSPVQLPTAVMAAGLLVCIALIGYNAGAHSAAQVRLQSANTAAQMRTRRFALSQMTGGAAVAAGLVAAPAHAENGAVKECTNPVACGPIAPRDGQSVLVKQTTPGDDGGISLSQAIPILFFGSLIISFGFNKVREMNDMSKAKESAASRVKELLESPEFDKYLKIETLTPGNGTDFPTAGNTIVVHYVGTLLDGTKFDSSLDRGQPLRFPVGVGRVIKGWDAALMKMSKGEKARITIQPEWAYGARNVGPIPANSVLVFEVELLGV